MDGLGALPPAEWSNQPTVIANILLYYNLWRGKKEEACIALREGIWSPWKKNKIKMTMARTELHIRNGLLLYYTSVDFIPKHGHWTYLYVFESRLLVSNRVWVYQPPSWHPWRCPQPTVKLFTFLSLFQTVLLMHRQPIHHVLWEEWIDTPVTKKHLLFFLGKEDNLTMMPT